MQIFHCTCGNRLFFESTQCVACGAEVGWCEACRRMTTLAPLGEGAGYRCSHADCQSTLQKCHNFAVENVCNRLFAPEPLAAGATADDAPGKISAEALCGACRLNDTIPDLSVPVHRVKWARLEAAKRRLLNTIDRLGLPYAAVEPRLSFDFKADVEPPANDWRNAGAKEIVYTGHAKGKITINIREADDAVREKLRVKFHEAHRTLIGHFHHEIGHYYWQLLVQGRREKEFIQLFGDHKAPPYAEAMAAYYENGPRPDWQTSYISAYATAHPWEDFAETFALYLDMATVLDTAHHLFKSVRVNFRSRTAAPLVARYQEVGVLVNEFNRSVGLIDLVPEVIAAPVVAKLELIHKIVKGAAKPPRARRTAAAPVAAMQQQGGVQFEPALTPSPGEGGDRWRSD